ncbi:hypothetical protein TRIUR3_34183 [Triticum urartu]|uniref:Uncharacterized protein n=1 Tax=Triticum urartu TaxID=4572 RepID=M7Z202_TRIUA|nr:hypothetical protein TRIUR3_34183 [Triticum urartu]
MASGLCPEEAVPRRLQLLAPRAAERQGPAKWHPYGRAREDEVAGGGRYEERVGISRGEWEVALREEAGDR